VTTIPLTADCLAVAALLLHLDHHASRAESPYRIGREPSVNWEQANEVCRLLELAGLATIERIDDALHVSLTPQAANRLRPGSGDGAALRNALLNALASGARGGCHSILNAIVGQYD